MSYTLRNGRRIALPALVLAVTLALGLLGGSAAAKSEKGKGHVVNVMTRNLYLGADLAPAIAA